MTGIVQEMVRYSLDAFVRQDPELARNVIDRDDEVDGLRDQIFRELLTYMMGDPSTVPRAIDLILVFRNLERIADHATNIAEDVIYIVRGEDVRERGDKELRKGLRLPPRAARSVVHFDIAVSTDLPARVPSTYAWPNSSVPVLQHRHGGLDSPIGL